MVQSHTPPYWARTHLISVPDARCGCLHTCCGQEAVSADSWVQTPDKSWQTQAMARKFIVIHYLLTHININPQHHLNCLAVPCCALLCLAIHQPERLPNGEATQHLQSHDVTRGCSWALPESRSTLHVCTSQASKDLHARRPTLGRITVQRYVLVQRWTVPFRDSTC